MSGTPDADDAVARLYDRTVDGVYGVVLSIVRDPAIAGELTQEVYLELWSVADDLDATPVQATARLVALAHRKAVEQVRSVESHARHDLSGCERSRCAEGADHAVEGAEPSASSTRVRDAVASLPEMSRRAIELAYFGGHSCPDVARLLGVSLDSVRGGMRDALVQLRPACVSAKPRPGGTMWS